MRIQAVQYIIDFIRQKNRKHKFVEFHKTYIPPTNTYKNLIFTQGFGHSGSGVIIDLLSEFDNTTVFGGHDLNGGGPLSKCKNVVCFEFDFLRLYGGIFNLENICREFPRFYKKHHIMNFINLVEYYFQSNIPIFNDKFLELSYDFVDKLVKKKIKISDPIAEDVAFKYERPAGKVPKNLIQPYHRVGGKGGAIDMNTT